MIILLMIGGIILKLEVVITSIVTLLGAGIGSWIAIKGNFNLYNKQTKSSEMKTNYILKRNLRGIDQKLERLIFFNEAMENGDFQDFEVEADFASDIEKIESFISNIDSLDYHNFSMSYIKDLQELLHFLDRVMEECKTNIKYHGMEEFSTANIESKSKSAQSMCREVIAMIDKEILKK